jgi:hypothetical protein
MVRAKFRAIIRFSFRLRTRYARIRVNFRAGVTLRIRVVARAPLRFRNRVKFKVVGRFRGRALPLVLGIGLGLIILLGNG